MEILLLILTEIGDDVVVLIINTGKELTALYAADICSWFPGKIGFMKIESKLQLFDISILMG